jgi:hypothetical protein
MRTELRHGRWRRLASGVLLTRPEEPTRADWVNVGLHLGGPFAALSGWDAVRLRGLGASRPPAAHVLILTTKGENRVVGGVHLRPSARPLSVTQLSVLDDAFPAARVVRPARAVADTSLMYHTLAPVRALVTSAVQREQCTADELYQELEDGPRNGSAFLRRALEDVFGGAASISEAELADALRTAGLPPFELNVPILDATGRHVATADALWRALRAVLEVDSREHHFLEPQWRNTMTRHNLLTRSGLALTHYPPVEIRRATPRVTCEVGEWLRARAEELKLPYPPPRPADWGRPLRLSRARSA